LRILIIILVLISKFTFGQKTNATIGQNIVKYEIKDEFNRFDDIANETEHYKSFAILNISNSVIEIVNRYSSGFTGHKITIKLNKKLNIDQANYEYWTDVMEIDTPKYVVDKVDLKLNQNPFEKINRLQGQYTMQIKKISSDGNLLSTIEFKGKFKNFNGIEKTSPDYQWTLEQNKIFYGITNDNGVSLRPDKMPNLKSDHNILIKEIQKLNGFVPDKLNALVVINEKGRIEQEPFRFFGDLMSSDIETQNQVKNLLIEITEWNPACLNEKEVKSQVPITFELN